MLKMLEPVNNSTSNIKSYNFRSTSGRVNSFMAARPSSNTETESPGKNNRPDTGMPSQSVPEQLKKDLAVLRDIDIQFSVHEETGKTMIKIVDKENNEIIREIPSREDLERSARFREFVGQLFDVMA